MKIFYPHFHMQHDPQKDYSDGFPPLEHPEKPIRLERVLQGAIAASKGTVEAVKDHALEAVTALHDRDYVDFLLAISDTIKDPHEYLPSIFRDSVNTNKSFIQGGMYCKEIGTPIGKGSINAALNSAATSVTAAEYMLQKGNDAIAVCRPPGHHAGRRTYGGYCFFNNAYLAARHLSKNAACCPVLDIDYHIGDGSLEFADEKAPYFSLHADPWRNYPYLEKTFKLDREFVDLKILPDAVDGEIFCRMLSEMLSRINAYTPDFMVLSMGFDTLISDKFQDAPLCLQVTDYIEIGKLIASSIKSPILFLLEGGYDIDNLEQCANNFVSGFISKRGP